MRKELELGADRELVVCEERAGLIGEVWSDEQTIDKIEEPRYLYCHEIQKPQTDDSILVEFDFYKSVVETTKSGYIKRSPPLHLKTSTPRLTYFTPSATLYDVTQTIKQQLKDVFSTYDGEDQFEV